MVGRDVVPRPAHLHPDTVAPAVVVRDLLYPDFARDRASLDARQAEVDRVGGPRADRLRTEEQLNDKDRLLRALDVLTLTAVRVLVARPRTWRQWTLLEAAHSLWDDKDETTDAGGILAPRNRLLACLFDGHAAATEAMHKLAAVVRRCEDAEVVGCRACPRPRRRWP